MFSWNVYKLNISRAIFYFLNKFFFLNKQLLLLFKMYFLNDGARDPTGIERQRAMSVGIIPGSCHVQRLGRPKPGAWTPSRSPTWPQSLSHLFCPPWWEAERWIWTSATKLELTHHGSLTQCIKHQSYKLVFVYVNELLVEKHVYFSWFFFMCTYLYWLAQPPAVKHMLC